MKIIINVEMVNKRQRTFLYLKNKYPYFKFRSKIANFTQQVGIFRTLIL